MQENQNNTEPVVVKSKNSNLLPGTMLILFIISLGISFKINTGFQEDATIITANNHRQLLDSISSQNVLIAGFKAENRLYQIGLKQAIQDRQGIIETQKLITKSYANLQAEIRNASDTAQYSITKELLAKHRAKPLERN